METPTAEAEQSAELRSELPQLELQSEVSSLATVTVKSWLALLLVPRSVLLTSELA